MPIYSATDSLVKYLVRELRNDPPVHWVRMAIQDPEAGSFKVGCLNLVVLSARETGSMEDVLVSLDLLGTDERQVAAWAEKVKRVLSVESIPELDYASTPTPRALGRNVYWRGDGISFDIIRSGADLFHVNSTFLISHQK